MNTSWTGGDIRLKNGARMINSGLWVDSCTNEMSSFSGRRSQFVNNGLTLIQPGAGAESVLSCDVFNNGTMTLGPGSLLMGGLAPFVQTSGVLNLQGNRITVPSTVPLVVQSGYLFGPGAVVGSLISSGEVAPQGRFNVTNAYTQQPTGSLMLDIYGMSNFSVFNISNVATLSGVLLVRFYFTPAAESRFPVLYFGPRE